MFLAKILRRLEDNSHIRCITLDSYLCFYICILNRTPKQRFVFLETERMTIQKCPSVCVRSKRLGAAPLPAAWLSAPLWVSASLLWSPKGKEALDRVNLFHHIISSFMFCQHYLHIDPSLNTQSCNRRPLCRVRKKSALLSLEAIS